MGDKFQAVMNVLQQNADNNGDVCMSYDNIAREAGFGGSAQYYLKQLIADGKIYIKSSGRGKKPKTPNTYHITGYEEKEMPNASEYSNSTIEDSPGFWICRVRDYIKYLESEIEKLRKQIKEYYRAEIEIKRLLDADEVKRLLDKAEREKMQEKGKFYKVSNLGVEFLDK